MKARRSWLVAAALAMGLTVAAVAATGPQWLASDAASMARKIELIAANGSADVPRPLRTTVTESELNAYLEYELRPQFPAGVVEPRVWLLGAGRVTARAVVDLDEVKKARGSRGFFDPLRWLSGRLPVTASGVVTAVEGVARLEFERADISGVPIPKALLQELITYYTRTATAPTGVSLDDPFPLPARIRSIDIGRSDATIVQ